VSPTIMMSVGEHSNDTLSKLQSVQKTILPIAQITQNCWVSGEISAIFFLLKTCFEYSRFGWQVSSFHWTAILNACHNTHNTSKKKQQCLNQRVGMWNHLTPWNLKTSPWRKKYPAFFFLLSFGLAASCFQDVSKCIFMYLYVSSWRGAKDTKIYVVSKWF